MSGVYDSVEGEGKQARLYGADELCVVTVGEIGAADGTLKQSVARKKHSAVFYIKAHASC